MEKICYKKIAKYFKLQPITIANKIIKWELPLKMDIEQFEIFQNCWVIHTQSINRAQKIEDGCNKLKEKYFNVEAA